MLLLTRFRSQPEQPGAYMVGAGVAGAAILISVMAGCSLPSCHYDVRTPFAVLVFVVVAAVGGGLIVQAVRQGRFSSPVSR